jgi:hypothetical protein
MCVCLRVCVCVVCVCVSVSVCFCLCVYLVRSTPACDTLGASLTDAAGTAAGASLKPMRTSCTSHCLHPNTRCPAV